MKIFIISILSLFIISSEISEQDINDIYKSSTLVVNAKVIDIRAVSGMKVICNLEVNKIYKGKRRQTFLIQLDQEDDMEMYKSYLLYLDEAKDKNSSFLISKRRVISDSEFFKNEIDYLVSVINGKKFKKVKNPEPKHPIRFDCGCD